MKLTKCDKGHFYDADKYEECPHCEERAESSHGEKKVISEKPGMEKPSSESPKRDTLSPHTGSIWEQNADNKTAKLPHADEKESSAEPEVGINPFPNEVSASNAPPPEAQLTPQNNQSHENKPSLQAQVNAVASHSSTEDAKTVAFYDFSGSEPVVGWLVCVKGAYIGQSFNLKTGKNNIGRSMNMDVPLAQEPGVSRNIHAALTYEPQKRVFFIQAGESNGLTYLNKELVVTFAPLKIYDHIRLGACEFLFIPFCGEGFTWDEYIQ